jgi:hypothetical protein
MRRVVTLAAGDVELIILHDPVPVPEHLRTCYLTAVQTKLFARRRFVF